MSRVDVIVPCYNYAHFLHECVESVLAQPVDVRVLVIDDASPDDTARIGSEMAARDARVKFLRHEVNRGHIATYNEGLDWGSGEYLLLLSADDVLTPGALGRAVRLMDDHPEIGFAYGHAITTDRPDLGQYRPPPDDYRYSILTGTEFWEMSCREGSNLVPTPTAVVRTRLQQAIGGYRADLPHTGDLEMWLRFAAHAPVGILDCEQAFYRVHGSNMHKEMFPNAITVIEQHRKAFQVLFSEFRDVLPNRDRLEQSANRATAIGALSRATKMFERGEIESCNTLCDVALEIFPSLHDQREWSRFRVKKAMGRRLWLTLRSLRNRVRPRPALHRDPFGRSGIFPGI
jgi:glycosyltransferase involved in cell wall biosynthesis